MNSCNKTKKKQETKFQWKSFIIVALAYRKDCMDQSVCVRRTTPRQDMTEMLHKATNGGRAENHHLCPVMAETQCSLCVQLHRVPPSPTTQSLKIHINYSGSKSSRANVHFVKRCFVPGEKHVKLKTFFRFDFKCAHLGPEYELTC